MANEAINLNLIPDGVKPVAHVSQYDVGRTITFQLYQGAQSYTPPTGTTVEVRALKPDGHIVVYDDTYVSLSGSTITLTTSMQMAACEGETLCQFKLTSGTVEIATLNFWLEVQKDPAASGDISDTEIPGIIALAEEQMERAESAADVAESAMNDAIRQAGAAAASAQTAGQMASSAQNSASAAASSEDQAQYYANEAEDTVEDGIQTMLGLINDAQNYSEAAHDWAVGPTGSGSATDTNNAKYWSDLAAQYAQQFGSAVKWKGSIYFASIPTTGMQNGDFYNIKDAFTTDSRFEEGSGISVLPGADIVWGSDISKWNILTPSVYPDMQGATASAAGAHGLVPAPAAGDEGKALKGNGTWASVVSPAELEAVAEAKYNRTEANVLGAKNLNSYPYYDTTKTESGITFTDNGDGTVTVNGTATADMSFVAHQYYYTTHPTALKLKAGSYTITGCPASGSSSTYYVSIFTDPHDESTKVYDYGNGVEYTLTQDAYVHFACYIKSGTTVSNLTFKPMIRLASDPDDTWVPYAMTNRELTERAQVEDISSSVQLDTTKFIGYNNFQVKKCGNIVEVYFYNFRPKSVGDSQLLATGLPKPTTINVNGSTISGTGSTTSAAIFASGAGMWINASGELRAHITQVTVDNWCYWYAIYLTND